MLTFLETLIVAVNIPVLIWALLPIKKVPRFLDFLPSASVLFLILHLFIDNEPVRFRMVPLYIFTVTLFLMTIVRLFKHNPDQPKHRIRAAIGRIFALAWLTLCVLFPTVVLPFNTLPEPTGNYNVGTVSCDLTDNSRIEAFQKEAGKNRRLAVQFWYPVERTGSAAYDIEGAPVSQSEQSYPVVIFSHGAFGVRMSNASAFKELASHGYIVASIDHTYHSFYTSFSDGETAIINNEFLNNAIAATEGDISPEQTFKVSHEWLDLRKADVSFVIDTIKSGELKEAAFLNGHMDLSKIGLFGHSLGGASSAQVAREREDVKAAIVIDGTMIGDITGLDAQNKEILTDESFTKPLMLMYNSSYLDPEAKESSYLPNINAFNKATDAVYSLCIKNSGHLNFTDLPRISPFLSRQLGIGTVDAFDCIKIVNDYSLAFFDKHLKGKNSTLLDSPASELVVLDKRE